MFLPPTRNPLELLSRLFFLLSTIILLSAGTLKLISVANPTKVFGVVDPIFHLPLGSVWIAVSSVEILTALYLLTAQSYFKRLALIVWVSTCFGSYRLSLYLLGVDSNCKCLGSGFEWFPAFEVYSNLVSRMMFYVLLVGSYVLGLWMYLERARSGKHILPLQDRQFRDEGAGDPHPK